MEIFARLFSIAVIPLGILNALGGVVAFIWLAFLGEWGSIGYGFAGLFGGTFLIGIAMMPGLIFAIPAVELEQKGYKLSAALIGMLSAIYTAAVITLWCMGMLYFFVERANHSALIPSLLWTYTVSTAPIAFMAQKESGSGGGEFALISSFFTQVAFVVTVVTGYFLSSSLIELLIVFAAIMGISVLLQFFIAYLQQN